MAKDYEVDFYTGRVIEQYNTALERAMKEAVLIVEADARRHSPVDTGRLRASITNEVREIAGTVLEGRVGTNVDYAKYVELGTSKMPAQPYLRPALRKNFDKIVEIIQGAIE